MIRAIPRGIFSWSYDAHAESGESIPIEFSRFPEQAKFTIEGVEFAIHREGMFSGHFTLVALGRVLAEAHKTSAFTRSFEIEMAEGRYMLQPASPFGRSFDLLEGDREIGFIRPKGIFSRAMECVVPEHLSLPLQVFLLAFVLLIWRRQSIYGR